MIGTEARPAAPRGLAHISDTARWVVAYRAMEQMTAEQPRCALETVPLDLTDARAMMDEAERLHRVPPFLRVGRVFGQLGSATRRARWREEWRRSSQILELARI